MNAECRIQGSNTERFHRMRKVWQVCIHIHTNPFSCILHYLYVNLIFISKIQLYYQNHTISMGGGGATYTVGLCGKCTTKPFNLPFFHHASFLSEASVMNIFHSTYDKQNNIYFWLKRPSFLILIGVLFVYGYRNCSFDPWCTTWG